MRGSVLAVIAFVGGAVGGIVSTRALGEAHAEPGGIVVPVPAQGVTFRAGDGRAIARVRSEPAGGVIEVLDAREQVAVRMRATPGGGAIDVGPSTPPAPKPFWVARSPDDPGY